MIDFEIIAKNYNRLMSILISNAGGRRGNMSLIAIAVAGEMKDAVEENFEKEGRRKWKGLKDRTKKARARRGHWPGKILQDSGSLASSINTRHSPTEAFVGTNKKYGRWLQEGTSRMKARPFLKLTREDIENIQRLISMKLRKGT